MVFLFQVSARGANQPNSIKAQVQHEIIDTNAHFLTSVVIQEKLVILRHNFILHVSTVVYGTRILSSLYY